MGVNATVEWNGDEAKRLVQAGAVLGLTRAATHLLTEANRTIPLDQGPLQRSGGTDVDEGALLASVYYDTPYARRQHEELTWRHKPGRRAKWLEKAHREEARTIHRIIGQALTERLT